jgi:hypothetical protein
MLPAVHSRAWGSAIAPVNTLAGALACHGSTGPTFRCLLVGAAAGGVLIGVSVLILVL